VGLAMAIMVDLDPGIEYVRGSRIMFHIGGIAALTTLINASTMAKLMSLLGVIKTNKLQQQTISDLEVSMGNNVRALFDSHLKSRVEDDVRFNGADPDLVTAWVPVLQFGPSNLQDAKEWTAKEERQRFTLYRQIFLNVLSKEYWDAINDGVLPRKSGVTQVLLASTSEARDTASERLDDWHVVERIFAERRPARWTQKLIQTVSCPFAEKTDNQRICQAMLSFIKAHEHAQEHVPLYFGKGDPHIAHVAQQVNSESEHQCQIARQRLAELPEQAVTMAKSRMLAHRILHQQKEEVELWKKRGMLSEQEANEFIERIKENLRHILAHNDGTMM